MNRTTDVNAVAAIMDTYVTGTRTRDVGLLKTIFADGAVMTGYLGVNLLSGGPEPFYQALEANDVGSDYAAQVVHVEVTGATACGRIIEDNLLGMSFVNDFHLVKGPEGWKIVSKLFHHDAPEA